VSGQVDIQLRRSGTICVVDVKGEMDMFNSFKLKDGIKALVERNVRQYIINLEGLDYIDSSGIGAILYVYGELRKRGMALVVAGARGSVKRVIELTKLIGYLPLAPGLKEAIAAIRDRPSTPAEGPKPPPVQGGTTTPPGGK
jgi:anti-sigma B factor antagonist